MWGVFKGGPIAWHLVRTGCLIRTLSFWRVATVTTGVPTFTGPEDHIDIRTLQEACFGLPTRMQDSYTCIYISIYIYTYIQICTCIYTYIYTYLHPHLNLHLYLHPHLNLHLYLYIHNITEHNITLHKHFGTLHYIEFIHTIHLFTSCLLGPRP